MKEMDKRFHQAHKEAIWAVILTLLYLVSWIYTAYFTDSDIGITGFPRWFGLSCLFLPLIFIVLCWLMIKTLFKEMPLDDEPKPDSQK